MTDERNATYIAGLIRERDMYLANGQDDRAADVTAELARLGAEAKPPRKRASKR